MQETKTSWLRSNGSSWKEKIERGSMQYGPVSMEFLLKIMKGPISMQFLLSYGVSGIVFIKCV